MAQKAERIIDISIFGNTLLGENLNIVRQSRSAMLLLETAHEKARQYDQRSTNTGHLLLAGVQTHEPTARVFSQHGLFLPTLAQFYNDIYIQVYGENSRSQLHFPRDTMGLGVDAAYAFNRSIQFAQLVPGIPFGTEFVMLTLTREEAKGTCAYDMLTAFNIDLQTLRSDLFRNIGQERVMAQSAI